MIVKHFSSLRHFGIVRFYCNITTLIIHGMLIYIYNINESSSCIYCRASNISTLALAAEQPKENVTISLRPFFFLLPLYYAKAIIKINN